jgi:Big-like domain-containing protein
MSASPRSPRLWLAGAVLLGACSSASTAPTTDSPSPSTSVTALVAVSPDGGATGVGPGTSMTMQFSGPMAAGMEQYVDLHDGTVAGPLHAMSCTWSADRTTLTCVPGTPLQANTMYTLHLGAGMVAAAGGTVNIDPGTAMGGQWLRGGMMGGLHAGQPMSMMGGDWRGSNGSYGMMFAFTTS